MALRTSLCVFPNKISNQLGKLKDFRVRHKSLNSDEWLRRRDKDPYIELSKRKNYRCRSAFKLIQIDDRFKLLQPGFKVLDIGAAPGSWSQVLAERTNATQEDPNSPVGLVIAIDINTFQSIDGVVTLSNMDFNEQSSQEKILEILGEGEKFDFIFSDMAPPATGVRPFDQERIANLIYPVALFSIKHLRIGGGCLIKTLDGGENENIKNELQKFFKLFKFVKPNASYKSSTESYLLARDFVGLKT